MILWKIIFSDFSGLIWDGADRQGSHWLWRGMQVFHLSEKAAGFYLVSYPVFGKLNFTKTNLHF